MLDANELKRRLIEAMDRADPRVTSAALASACKVSPQAVNGWRTTGRVAKKHLTKIAELTGRPLEYFLGENPTVVLSHGMKLAYEEAEAIKRLRDAEPAWRSYVLALAMSTDHTRQKLFLDVMREAVPDYKVERAFGDAPHVKEKARK